jgi:hypothetical protein
MPTTRLTDIIDVKVFQDLPSVDSKEKVALAESGIISASPLFTEMANDAGAVGELPFWNDLDADSEANISTDDPDQKASPDKITQGAMSYRKAIINKSWSAMNLTREMAMGEDAIVEIRAKVDRYFQRQFQRRLIMTANGVLASNIANNGGDMVHDVSTTGTVSSGNLFTRGNFSKALFTLGDAFDDIAAIAVHSTVYNDIFDSNGIEYIQPSEGSVRIPTYQNKILIVDDGMPVITEAGKPPKFVSILFGHNVFAFGDGAPIDPIAVSKIEDAGNGAGEERLFVRKKWIIQPFGFKTNDIVPADGKSYTFAELAMADKWSRVVDRKNVPMAFLISN